jgi:glycine/D-amino acid oxidase-like deaminating enzyme
MSATVILGAGIIGTSTAYYHSKHQPPQSIHLVEASPELFASASGYAGGLLAKDWFSPAVAELGALSFDEHRKLAEKEDGATKWGYSRSTAASLANSGSSGGPKKEKKGRADGASRADEAIGGGPSACVSPPWLWTGEGDQVELIGEEGNVAQM